MAFTDHSDLFGSIHEEGINRVARHIMRQRPSLFNYATEFFVGRPDMLCVQIQAAREVIEAENPLFTVVDPIPVLGTPVPIGLNWSFQLTNAQIDFHPGNTIQLPPELNPLQPQRLAIRLRGCVGLDCPSDEVIQQLLPRIEILATARSNTPLTGLLDLPQQAQTLIVLPTQKLLCFCLELFVVAHVEWGTIGTSDKKWLKIRLDGLEICNLSPRPLEEQIECYLKTVLRLGILPRLSVPIESLVLNITDLLQRQGLKIGQRITLQPTPVPEPVPNNPAIEEDQLKVFINLVVEEV